MHTTLLRLGLWILVLVLALYVLHDSYADEPLGELIQMNMLQQALVVSGVLIVAGIVVRILGKGAKAVRKNRCRVCKTEIPSGAMFCRVHLRSMLNDEDEKTHMTRVRR
ncbi:MAG TPA: hypothetical protein VFN10_00120 [Thermoanaerobaculia bacterium]|nr:hypothetical protein [Thermoanaerobaculia bacterium]